MVVCGGQDVSANKLSSCLVLDHANQTWEENIMGSLPQPGYNHAVVTLNTIGNFMIKTTIDFLPQGSQQWLVGPRVPESMHTNQFSPCAVVISERSFLTISYGRIREYEANKEQPTSEAGWQEATKWPRLQTRRTGCQGAARSMEKW